MTQHHHALAGVVITASHNPYMWNGVKFKEGDGGSASPEYTGKIEKQILLNDQKKPQKMPLQTGIQAGDLSFFNPYQDYLKQLKKMVNVPLIRKAKLRVVMDPLYGAGTHFIPKLLGTMVQEVRTEENPGFGGVNPEPIESNLKTSMEKVIHTRSQIGLATDGDADRIGAIDEKGRFVSSQQIFALILRHLLTVKKWKGGVVKTVSTTQMVDRLATQFGFEVRETPIGFKHICEEFRRGGILMGGEESGGIGITPHVNERDGLFCGLLLLEILATLRKPFSKILDELQKELGPFHYRRNDLHLPVEKIQIVKEKLQAGNYPTFPGFSFQDKNLKDGFKFLFTDGSWLLIRPSGTEPLLRIYAEAPSLKKVQQLLAIGKEFAENIEGG
jgi:phosphomannomutase